MPIRVRLLRKQQGRIRNNWTASSSIGLISKRNLLRAANSFRKSKPKETKSP
jgi:hypothetical protein